MEQIVDQASLGRRLTQFAPVEQLAAHARGPRGLRWVAGRRGFEPGCSPPPRHPRRHRGPLQVRATGSTARQTAGRSAGGVAHRLQRDPPSQFDRQPNPDRMGPRLRSGLLDLRPKEPGFLAPGAPALGAGSISVQTKIAPEPLRRGGRSSAHYASQPPVTCSTSAVMKLASSLARKAMAAATSPGLPKRFSNA